MSYASAMLSYVSANTHLCVPATAGAVVTEAESGARLL